MIGVGIAPVDGSISAVSRTATMPGWFRLAAALASRRNLARRVGLAAWSSRRRLIATGRPRWRSMRRRPGDSSATQQGAGLVAVSCTVGSIAFPSTTARCRGAAGDRPRRAPSTQRSFLPIGCRAPLQRVEARQALNSKITNRAGGRRPTRQPSAAHFLISSTATSTGAVRVSQVDTPIPRNHDAGALLGHMWRALGAPSSPLTRPRRHRYLAHPGCRAAQTRVGSDADGPSARFVGLALIMNARRSSRASAGNAVRDRAASAGSGRLVEVPAGLVAWKRVTSRIVRRRRGRSSPGFPRHIYRGGRSPGRWLRVRRSVSVVL